MLETNLDAAAWVLAAAEALRRHDSWTGRIHIQKHLFITQALGLGKPPFDFVLYDYGPYSFDLDEKIIDLELFGLLSRSYPEPGYGPKYEPTLPGLKIARGLKAVDHTAVERVAEQLGDRKSQDLELIATCLWVERNEKILDAGDIIRRVKELKPKYRDEDETIRRGFSSARAIATALVA